MILMMMRHPPRRARSKFPPRQTKRRSNPPFPTIPPLIESLRRFEPSEDHVRASWNPCAKDKLYSFLLQCARANITDVCKEYSVPRWGGKDAMVEVLYAHLLRGPVSGGLTTESDLEHISIKRARTKKCRTISEFLFDQKDSCNANFVPWSRAPVVSDDERNEEPTGELAASNVPRSEISSRERGEPRAGQISVRTTKEPAAMRSCGKSS
jgi:hypothetical protein